MFTAALAASIVVPWIVAPIALNGDVTTEDSIILPHILIAICVLGLSVWAVFWGLIQLRHKMPEFSA